MVLSLTIVTLVSLLAIVGAMRPSEEAMFDHLRQRREPEGEVITWDGDWAGVKDARCGVGVNMKVAHVPIPWEKMNSRVQDARSNADCHNCGFDLEDRGILQPGWECRRAWFGLNFLRFRIFRRGDTGVRKGFPPVHTFNLTEADLNGKPLPFPVATSPLPLALRGIFWLADQKSSSAVATFAQGLSKSSQPDCKWCSSGKLIANGYRMMPAGDCHWAFATVDGGRFVSGYGLATDLGVVYDFIFDNAEDPTYGTIGPNLRAGPGGWFNWGEWLKNQRWLGHFEMFKETPEVAEELGFPGSVMWRRSTLWLWGAFSTFPYHMTQVVDENGERIEPAWSKFVEYQQSDVAGDSPGILHYHGDC